MMAALVGAAVGAHEGHDHKVMGTVSVIHENHLEVKATDGKTSVITLNDKTKILRGKKAASVADISIGERVVVTATQTKDQAGTEHFVAKEVRLGTGAAPAGK
jgi:hypothetical protein